jgi:hypothetical protein
MVYIDYNTKLLSKIYSEYWRGAPPDTAIG